MSGRGVFLIVNMLRNATDLHPERFWMHPKIEEKMTAIAVLEGKEAP
jgi:hypothetical protein